MILRTYIFGIIALSVLTGCATRQQSVTIPVDIQPYVCSQVSDSIVLDGKLDELAWQQAERIDTFYPYSPKNAVNLSSTTARLAWDAEYLYIAIECDDDDVWSYSDQPDDQLWNGDVAEIFIKPSKDCSQYYEFVIAPNGTLYDAYYPSRGAGGYYRFREWSSGAKIATEVNGSDGTWTDTDTGYTVEMVIPFTAFDGIEKQSVAGTVWTFGVFRYDYSKSHDYNLLMMSIPESKKRGFHYYEGYKPLIFQEAERRGRFNR